MSRLFDDGGCACELVPDSQNLGVGRSGEDRQSTSEYKGVLSAAEERPQSKSDQSEHSGTGTLEDQGGQEAHTQTERGYRIEEGRKVQKEEVRCGHFPLGWLRFFQGR